MDSRNRIDENCRILLSPVFHLCKDEIEHGRKYEDGMRKVLVS